MARNKKSKKQEFQGYMNEMDDVKAHEMREMMDLNFKINSKFKNEKQKALSETIKDNRVTFVSGSPGTGKTFITLKVALELLKKEQVGEILLTTPVIEVSQKSIGALPGDIESKIGLYFEHFYDNIEKLVGKKTKDFLRTSELVNNKIVNFVRGATFGKVDEEGEPVGTFCILDEAQNLTVSELKTYISRLGEKSQMVILGDPEQCDLRLRDNEKNALSDAMERFYGMDNIGFVEFTEDDIVRDKFLIDIMKKYKL